MDSLPEDVKSNSAKLCIQILDAIFTAEANGMGRDHIAQALAASLVIACKNFGLSYQFCQDSFDESLNDVYELEDCEEEESPEEEPTNCQCCSCCPSCTGRE